jgi:ankyrin repeat protein
MLPEYNPYKSSEENYEFWTKLTENELGVASSENGETLFHEAARLRAAKFVKRNLFQDELLAKKTKRGESVYLYLAQHGEANLIPKELLTRHRLLEASDRGESPLYKIIEHGHLELVNEDLIKGGILLEKTGMLQTNYIHFCAMCGELKKVPKEIWIDELGLTDSSGNNLMHWAADGSRLKDYEVTKKSIELIKQQNRFGESPLHRTPYLSEVPQEYLYEEALLLKNDEGNTPIHKSARSAGAQFLPTSQMTEKILITKNNKGETPLDIIKNTYNNNRDYPNFEKLVKCLSNKTLKELLKGAFPPEMRSAFKSEALKKGLIEKVTSKNELTI